MTVWCAFWSGSVIGLYFFENEAGHVFIVNEDRFWTMITEYLWIEMKGINVKNVLLKREVPPAYIR